MFDDPEAFDISEEPDDLGIAPDEPMDPDDMTSPNFSLNVVNLTPKVAKTMLKVDQALVKVEKT